MKRQSSNILGYAANISQGRGKSQSTGFRHINEMSLAFLLGFIFIKAVMQSAACRKS